MRYIKTYENYIEEIRHGGDVTLTIDGVMKYLQVEVEYPEDAVVIPVSKYDIDVIDFFKEIFLNKYIVFLSVDAPEGHPYVSGKIKDVSQIAYQDEFFITVKLNEENDWTIINNRGTVLVSDYDAENKPLHKEVEMKKEAENYNL